MKSRSRGRRTNRPTAGTSRRVRDLYEALAERLGRPTDVLIQAAILAAAELRAASEAARTRLLAGEITDPDQVVRLENAANRAERRVIKMAPTARAPSIGDYLARGRRIGSPNGA